MQLIRWIRKSPSAEQVRVETADGTTKTVQVGPKSNGRRWKDAERAVMDLGPNGLLEALDANGVVLRTTRIEGEPAPVEEEEDTEKLAKGVATIIASTVERIAKVITEAHNAGAERHAAAYEGVMAHYSSLAGMMAGRLSGVESAWMKLLNVRARELQQAGPEEEGEVSFPQLLQLAMAHQGAGAQSGELSEIARLLRKMAGEEQKPNGAAAATNGVHKPPPQKKPPPAPPPADKPPTEK